MACDKPTGDCTNVSPCGAGCGDTVTYCPTARIDCDGVEPGYGYGVNDNLDPAATIELRSCSGNSAESIWIYPTAGTGHSVAVRDCDETLRGYAANSSACITKTLTPVLPKCQDVALTPGTFTHATITVNAQGCISAVTQGEPELYTPDECCGGTNTGGDESGGGRGLKGDPGAAATIAVQEVIGTGTAWSVENVGTSSAAIFKFTAPAPSTGGDSSSGGATGNVGGFKIVDGLVQDYPTSLVTAVEAKATGNNAALILFQALPDLSNEGEWDITLNIDPLFDSLTTKFQGLHDAQQETINSLVAGLASAVNRIGVLEGKVTTLESKVLSLETRVTSLETPPDSGSSGGLSPGGM